MIGAARIVPLPSCRQVPALLVKKVSAAHRREELLERNSLACAGILDTLSDSVFRLVITPHTILTRVGPVDRLAGA